MSTWDPWPGFLPPPEYAGKRASDLLLSIIGLAQAVPPTDPRYPDAQAALQKAQDLLGHAEANLAPLLRDWGLVAGACRFAEDGDWAASRTELESF